MADSEEQRKRREREEREDRLLEVGGKQEISDVNGNKGKEGRLSSGFRCEIYGMIDEQNKWLYFSLSLSDSILEESKTALQNTGRISTGLKCMFILAGHFKYFE